MTTPRAGDIYNEALREEQTRQQNEAVIIDADIAYLKLALRSGGRMLPDSDLRILARIMRRRAETHPYPKEAIKSGWGNR